MLNGAVLEMVDVRAGEAGGGRGGKGRHTMPEGRKEGGTSWRSSVKAPGRRVRATARSRSLRRYCV